jgi:hypothetical protein
MINNYRVNFGGQDIDYKDNFKDCRKYFPVLKKLYAEMDESLITAWHFFEPYVEFTWIDDDPDMMEIDDVVGPMSLQRVLDILGDHKIKPTLIHRPENGVVVDWYCKSPEEQEFGYKTYAASAKMAMLFWKYESAIAEGCGEKNQYMRRSHVLANQIGMNYNEERLALAQRGTIAGLFWDIGDHAKAVEAYEKMFEEKYL